MFSIPSGIKRNDILCFYFINRRFHCRMLNMFMKTITQAGSTAFAVSVALFSLAFNRHFGNILILNLVFSQAIIHLLKRFINRPRPYKTLEWAIAINPPKCKYSLPSGHSGSSLSIALVFSLLFPALDFIFISIAICVGISRVYLGYHYPTDVLAGFIISYVIFTIMDYTLLMQSALPV